MLEILAGQSLYVNYSGTDLVALSVSPLFGIQIAEGQTTTAAPVTLEGIVASFTLAPATGYTTTSRQLTLSNVDQAGNVIIGAGALENPVTLVDSDSTGATGLSLNGSAPAQQVTVTVPTDTITLTDNGTAVDPTITATAQSYSAQTDFPAKVLGYGSYYGTTGGTSSMELYCGPAGCQGTGSGTIPVDSKPHSVR